MQRLGAVLGFSTVVGLLATGCENNKQIGAISAAHISADSARASASRAVASAQAAQASAEASLSSAAASQSSPEASATTATPTPTSAAPETTQTTTTAPVTTTARATTQPAQTTTASPQPGNFIPTEVNFSRMPSPNACQQGGSTGNTLVPVVTPECDGQSLVTNESAAPKVGQTVIKACYIQAGPNGVDDVWAVIKTSPDWAEPDRSGQAANGGYIGVVPAWSLLDQNAMAPCPSGYDTSGFPSVANP